MGGRREEFRIHAFIIYSSDVLFSLPAHINITEAEIRHNINIYTNRNQGMSQSRKRCYRKEWIRFADDQKRRGCLITQKIIRHRSRLMLIEFVMILSLNDEYRSDISSHGCLRPDQLSEQLYVLKRIFKWKDFETCQIDDKDLVIKKSPCSPVPARTE